ncbi:heavy metal translocating P-type ATPase [Chitinilyticum litopenaei]|uniref:heavy metal translocating P-type ATPase n=1 Tax=Chitinilyticum litopenaei TaxID=1121276 RepID=UPI0003F5417D|nr:heavy metal translocating P-type ATPase [Chitinilyticum litopenaei]
MSAPSCFHCAAPVPQDSHFTVSYRQREEPCCCAGCQAVARTIIDSGLERYYEDRRDAASRAAPLPDELLARLRLYDDESLQQSFVSRRPDQLREASLLLEGITCAACIWLNEQHIAQLPGVVSVSINYSTHRARVCWDPQHIQLSRILEAITAIGYQAHPYDQARAEAAWEKRRKQSLFRLWTAGLSMMQVMMFTVPIYMAPPGDIDDHWLALLNWAGMVLTLPVVLYSCWPFYVSAWRDLRRGRAGMDLPVSIGVLAAFLASLLTLLQGSHEHVYFDSVSMFVFLLLGGRYLEMRARHRAGAAAEQLVKLIPAFAHRLLSQDGRQQLQEYPVSALRIDDLIVCKPGEVIPVDGLIVEGCSEVDEALLTGESRPVPKQPGSSVTGGASNMLSPLTIRVSHVGEQTRLAAIVRLLDAAMQHKPRLAQLADRVSGWFVAGLLLVASLSWWYWQLHDPQQALAITVAVLVISCPCALSLATPAALVAATGHLARLGILSHRPDSLEDAAGISDVVLDKTGTLTTGKPALLDTLSLAIPAAEALHIAAALEASSSHPIAQAFHQPGITPASMVRYHPGLGISGMIADKTCFLGSPAFIAMHCKAQPALPDADSEPATVLLLADESQVLARFRLADQLRPDAATLVAALQAQGMKVHLLSGDNREVVAHVASQLQLGCFQAAASPEDKLAYVQALQKDGARVLMIGDGVNDAPVLAVANVSLAMGSGADISHASGDMVLLNNSLAHVASLLMLARKSRAVILQNLAWALAYNIVAIPLAVSGHVTPWLASIGMAGSSLLVVLNSLRLAAPANSGR